MPRVISFEFYADDTNRAAHFYRQLFGWRITSFGGPTDYWSVLTGPDEQPGINGSLMRRVHPIRSDAGATGYVCTVEVDNLDASFARALTLGGCEALPKTAVPGMGWLAYMKDTEGNVFGMLEPDVLAL